ncbi:MAG TPA: NAD(P)/FAD-dependent oxidoreductase [Protaetiibacter sp.]|nr:NAD(P)/FAD-dependent oxidoreductase [Protaetiibacter sp.]
MTERILIVGASLAGLRTAEALRRAGATASITVLGDEPHLPYNRPPLSKAILTGADTADTLQFPLRESVADVDWLLGSAAVDLDLDRARVTSADGTEHPFDQLVIATGVRARRVHTVVGRPRQCVIRTRDDVDQLRPQLQPGTRLVIIGNGLIGCETAASSRGLGVEVTVVGRSPLALERLFGRELAEIFAARHRDAGVATITAQVTDIVDLDEAPVQVHLDDGTVLTADVVVEAIGSEPNTDWLHGTGIDLRDGVAVDAGMRALRTDGSVVDDVFAVGDVASAPHPLAHGARRRIEHWNMPAEHAKRAAAVMVAPLAERDARARATVAPLPSMWTDQYQFHLLSYGLPALGDDMRLIENNDADDRVYGAYRGDDLVGVVGLGMRSAVLARRAEVLHTMTRYGATA